MRIRGLLFCDELQKIASFQPLQGLLTDKLWAKRVVLETVDHCFCVPVINGGYDYE